MNDMDQTQMLMNQNFIVWSQPPFSSIPPFENRGVFHGSQSYDLFTTPTNHGRGIRKGNRLDRRRKRNDSLGSVYNPSNWNELNNPNRLKSRRFYPKKSNYRFPPLAPRNTTSFLIRAKRSGGIASLVSPYPVTPAVLATPIFSPSKEILVDMAKEEWGVDGYGSMKGLIRLRSSKDYEDGDDDIDDDSSRSGDSDVEEHLEVERRLKHDLSRFEMIYPTSGAEEQSTLMESRVDDQDSHLVQLEEENLTLKERLIFMERELEDLRRRVQCLETKGLRFQMGDSHNTKQESAVSENVSENAGIEDGCSGKSINDGGNE